MTRIIAVAGAQGTGKTYLARGIANELNKIGKKSDYVSEIAREWIGKFGIPQDVADQLDIFQLQLEREEATLNNSSLEYLVVDSPLYLPYLYGIIASDIQNIKEQFRLQRLFSRVLKYSPRYFCNIVLTQKKHDGEDSLRVWGEETESIISSGMQFFLRGCKLPNIYKVNNSLEFEERVTDSVNFILELENASE